MHLAEKVDIAEITKLHVKTQRMIYYLYNGHIFTIVSKLNLSGALS